VLLFQASKQTAALDRQLTEVLRVFFEMVRCGPLTVMNALEVECGGWTAGQRISLYKELRGSEETRANLDFLRGLLTTTKIPASVLSSLERAQCFTPLAP
jgi:hypothetical protein